MFNQKLFLYAFVKLDDCNWYNKTIIPNNQNEKKCFDIN